MIRMEGANLNGRYRSVRKLKIFHMNISPLENPDCPARAPDSKTTLSLSGFVSPAP